jgi:hypothetical protein
MIQGGGEVRVVYDSFEGGKDSFAKLSVWAGAMNNVKVTVTLSSICIYVYMDICICSLLCHMPHATCHMPYAVCHTILLSFHANLLCHMPYSLTIYLSFTLSSYDL